MSNEMQSGALGCRKAMKSTRTNVSIMCVLAAAGLAICLVVERAAWSELAQENGALRQQLSPMEALIAENQRLLELIAEAKDSTFRRNVPTCPGWSPSAASG